MSKIDLSKAKIGDKFRTRDGRILEYKGKSDVMIDDNYLFDDKEERRTILLFRNGSYMLTYKHELDLIEQVLDKPLDELIEEGTKQIKENDDAIAEEKELQRREEVVELAEKLVINELFAVTNHIHDMRELGAAINLDSPTEYAFLIAEEFVNNKSKYLKNGKLC
jgi:phosphosulfolactate synthase (CoM biosynthesis protein A)